MHKMSELLGLEKESIAIVFKLQKTAGLYSEFFFLCEAYLYANEKNADFYVDSSDWLYKHSLGWHDYFSSLNEWSESFFCNYKSVKFCSHRSVSNLYDVHLFNGAELCRYTLQDYIYVIEKIYIYNKYMDDTIRDVYKKISNGSSYDAVFIRKGDKITSGESIDCSVLDIINQVDSNEGVLFVQTDDSNVIKELLSTNISHKIKYIVPPYKKGAVLEELKKMTPEEVKKNTEEVLIGMEICRRANKCWTDNSSNVGRFLKLSNPSNVIFYAIDNTETIFNTSDVSPNPAHRDCIQKYKSPFFIYKDDDSHVFIIIRTINNGINNDNWYKLYKNIRKYYKNHIYIIDKMSTDELIHSKTTQLREKILENCTILRCNTHHVELYALYRFKQEFKLKTAVMIKDNRQFKRWVGFGSIYDSCFFNSKIPTYNKYTLELIDTIKNNESVKLLYNNINNWVSCVEYEMVITHEMLTSIDDVYNIFGILDTDNKYSEYSCDVMSVILSMYNPKLFFIRQSLSNI